MMQWVPTANGPLDSEKELFRAFSDVFPHATMWWQLGGGCALLIGTKQPLTIDYQKLKAHMQEGRVAQDMALSQVRDTDHLLAMFVFDEAGYAEFVRDVLPTSDDHTMLDFSMPRYAGSGFGLGQFNRKVKSGADNPFSLALKRRAQYFSLHRPVLPLLTNLGGEAPEEIARRIDSRRSLPFTNRYFLESDWKRLREDGSMPVPVVPKGKQGFPSGNPSSIPH